MMLRWKTMAATFAVAALALAGCAATEESSSEEPTSVVIGQFLAPATFDVTQAEWGNRALYYQAVYDTLLYGESDGSITGNLATEFTYSEDNKELTLVLRDDVEFTDGTPLTAEVVVENLERFKNGGGAFSTDLANVDTFEAPDATTVVLTLSAPDPALLAYLSREAGLIAAPATFDAEDADTNPIGSGPYILDQSATTSGTSYVFTKNPDYWNPDGQHWDTVTMNVLADPTAGINAVQAGEVDTMVLTDNNNLDQVEAAGYTISASELNFQGLLLLDRGGEMDPAMGDVRVRQAINYALDREGLLEALQVGNGTVTTQVFNKASAAYDPELDSFYTYDPEKARELLADAGYADGLDLQMSSTAVLGAAQFPLIGQQLADVGITVEWVDTPVENYITDITAPKYPAVPMQLETNADWQMIQFMISRTAPFNPFGFGDETTDALIAEIQNGDQATQEEKAAELNAYIVEQGWFAPYYRVSAGYAFNPETTDVTINATNIVPSIFDIKPAQ
jgi:peptide/nickel transport system substrate-binding protein